MGKEENKKREVTDKIIRIKSTEKRINTTKFIRTKQIPISYFKIGNLFFAK